MRLKELRGLPVIDPTAARRIGTVSDYQVDPAAGRLAALDISLDGGEGQRILAQRIRRVGGSAVMLTARGGLMPSSASELNERWLDASTLVGLEVMDADGTRVGHLVDATFDQDSLVIDAYLLQGGSFLDSLSGKRNRIEPVAVHSCSRELMLVASGAPVEAEAPLEPEATVEPQAPLDPEATVEPEATPETTGASDETAPIETSVPLKEADKLSAHKVSKRDTVRDGQPVSTSSA